MHKKAYGFTIVELLIVIVVIAILAAISIVAYTGIQNRANDAAVQSDIRSFAGKIREYEAIEGRFPAGATATGSSLRATEGVGNFSLARNSYRTTVNNNFYYCRGIVGGVDTFGVIAVSASGQIYAYRSDGGAVRPVSGTWATAWLNGTICPTAGVPTSAVDYSYSVGRVDGVWGSWNQ